MLLVMSAAGLAGAQAGGPDLVVSIAAKPNAPRRHQRIEMWVTVTNQGQAAASGTVVTVSTSNGLSSPRLISATPDTVQTSCAVGGGPVSAPQCTMTPVPPSCKSADHRLTCRYSSLQLQPAGQPGDSLTIIVGATTGTRPRQTALAGVTSDSPDANPANNSARFTLHVRGGKKSHRR